MIRALFLLLFLPATLWASGDKITQSNDPVTTQEVVTGSSDSVAFGYGPDNDINECLAHWSALIVTFPKRNKFCETLSLVAWAEHPETHTPQSIKIMCSTSAAEDVFDTRDACINTFTSDARDGGVPTTPRTPGPDDEETRPDAVGEVSECGGPCPDAHDIVIQQVAEVEQEYEDLDARLARIERGNRIAAQKAQERRDYAQQTIDKLQAGEDESER